MPIPIALDYRPAVLSPAGIGRATRELVRELANDERIERAWSLHLFAHSLARARVPVDTATTARLHRAPLPGRLLPFAQRLGLGADRLAGNARVFHWTDYVQPPVSRARTVLTVHDLAFARDASWHGEQADELRRRTTAAVRSAHVVVAPSRTTADDLRTFVPDAAPARVIPFGSDHVPRTRRWPDPLQGRAFALCVGTIEPRKNHRTLLRAWRLLAEPRPLLVVVGRTGWACAEIVRELEQAEREGLAVWHRRADDAALWPLLQNARLLAYPSLWEGFGFPPLEAMALGVPVVGHDAAPLQELGDGAVALADCREAAALAAALQRVLDDDSHRRACIDAGRRRAASFSWRACARAHADLYLELAGSDAR